MIDRKDLVRRSGGEQFVDFLSDYRTRDAAVYFQDAVYQHNGGVQGTHS